MDFYKPICKHIVMPLWSRWERSPYLTHLEYLDKSQYFSEEKIAQLQWEKIRRLLDHAYENCPYYKRKFKQSGIHPKDIKSFTDYQSIPILEKKDVHQYSEDLFAPNIVKYKPFLTSGSTGKPLTGYIDKESSELKRACGRRSEFWAGYDLGERIYCLYGNPEKELTGLAKFRKQFRRKYLARTEVLDLLNLTEESMLRFAKKMRKAPPSLLWGHAHGLYLLASFLEKQGILDIQPKGMYSAGMVLHDFERKKTEKVFNCVLQDRYGCEELGLIATECKKQEGLHINTDVHYVEVVNGDGVPVDVGSRGHIIITDLTNMAMPFIRYKLEDVIVLSEKRCSCGRTQPLISKIEGRISDFLISPEGALISGISLTDHFAGQIPGVAQIQMIQQERDVLMLKIVRDGQFDASSQKTINHLVQEFFGEKMRVQYDFVTKIPQEESGKYRFAICNIKHELF